MSKVGLQESGLGLGVPVLQPHSWLAVTCPVCPHPVAALPPGPVPMGQGEVRHGLLSTAKRVIAAGLEARVRPVLLLFLVGFFVLFLMFLS